MLWCSFINNRSIIAAVIASIMDKFFEHYSKANYEHNRLGTLHTYVNSGILASSSCTVMHSCTLMYIH